jgi:formamidase
MGRYLSVAMVQMQIAPGDTEANVSKMLRIAEEASYDFPWVNMFCFSELVIPGFNAATWQAQAETIPGPSTDRFAELAQRRGIYIQPGSMFEIADGKIYNSAPVLGPDGSLVANHRKMFPWQPLEPSEPGTEFTVFDIPEVGRIGLCICYDFWFPEMCRQLTWMGAEVILHPTMTPTSLGSSEKIIAQARALENQVYIVSCGGCGLHGGLGLAGGSLIVDAEGRIMAELGDGENVVTEVLDLDKVTLAQEYGLRAGVPIVKHLAHFNPKLPIYEDLRAGDVYKRVGACDTISTYAPRRQITLPFEVERSPHL